MKLADIISYEPESTYLDFKLVQYKKNNHEELIKDIMSMANANTREVRYIICGIKYFPDGTRDIAGLQEPIHDAAIYQQLIHENIEPSLDVRYVAETYEGKTLAVFQVPVTSNKPYLMKKDFNNLRKGDGYIRKGTHQTRLSRADLEEIYQERFASRRFTGEVECVFQSNRSTILRLTVERQLDLPSQRARKKIERILAKKEAELALIVDPHKRRIMDFEMSQIGGTPYENRSTSTLRQNLKNVDKTYAEDDRYYVCSSVAKRISLLLTNKGQEFLEDCSLEILIPKMEGIYVFDRIVSKPEGDSLFAILHSKPPPVIPINYPQVSVTSSHYQISEAIGNLKHNVSSECPDVPFRLLIGENMIGRSIAVEVRLHARNLPQPREFSLTLQCV